MNKNEFYKHAAEKLIEKLKQGTAPWQRPWNGGVHGSRPTNPTTEKHYKGGNALLLMAQDYDDPRWMTYKQAEKAGAQVKKGERGTPIVYWQFQEQRILKDDRGKPILGENGEPQKRTVELERPRAYISHVFNASQIDGLPPLSITAGNNWYPSERTEAMLENSGAKIEHRAGHRAFYRPNTDSITLPLKNQFSTAADYYSTALHELGHWTGHENRLNRDLAHPFGSEGYAREELRAEIASFMLGLELGTYVPPLDNHAAYVASWVKKLEEDPREIFRAAADAEKILDYIMGFELGLEQRAALEVSEREQPPIESDHEEQAQERAAEREYAEIKEVILHTFSSAEKEAAQEYVSAIHMMRDAIYEHENTVDNLRDEEERTLFEVDSNYDFDTDTVKNEKKALQAEAAYKEASKALDAEFFRHNNEMKIYKQQIAQLREALGPEKIEIINPYLFNFWREEKLLASKGDHEEQAQERAERLYLDVPYAEKDEAKELGAKWDRGRGAWYVPQGKDAASFEKWMPAQEEVSARPSPQAEEKKERVYLAVPYAERHEAREAGARWDSAARSWYVGDDGNMRNLAKWLPDHRAEQSPAMSPREEFAEVLRGLGCKVEGEHPVMDGKTHRIATEGDTQGARSGFYVGHLDGRPAGYAKNNRSGEEARWKSQGAALSPEERKDFAARCNESREKHASALVERQENAARRVWRQLEELKPVETLTPYLAAKGLPPQKGVFVGADGKTTCLPAQDAAGKIWTMQYIQEDGTKRFAKDARKEGCFHAVGGMDALEKAPVFVVSEGYATAGTLARALGHSVIAAFDSGNLAHVARALHEKYPDKPIVIAGDDDRHLADNPAVKKNVGREKAELAAKSVGGVAVFPTFAPEETGKEFKDFNDLGVRSRLGGEAVARQVRPAIEKARALKEAAREQRQQRKHAMSR